MINMGIADAQRLDQVFTNLNTSGSCVTEVATILDISPDYFVGLFNSEKEDSEKTIVKPASLAFTNDQKIEYIIESFIQKASVNVWFGQYGSKKTFIALSACINVALGKDWLGLKTKRYPALFIDEESGERRLQKRIKEGIIGEKAEKEIPLYYTSFEQFNFLKNQEESIQKIRYCILTTGAKLCFIDAFSDIMATGDENSVKDTQPVFMALRRLAEDLDCAFVIIHHKNKQKDFRGSTAIPGAVDSMVEISSKDGCSKIQFKTIKNRDGEPLKMNATIHWTENSFYLLKDAIEYSDEEKHISKQLRISVKSHS